MTKVVLCISPWNINLISGRTTLSYVTLLMSLDYHLMYNGCRIYEGRRMLVPRKFFQRNDSSLMSISKYFSSRHTAFALRSVSWHLSIIDHLPLFGLQWVLRSFIGYLYRFARYTVYQKRQRFFTIICAIVWAVGPVTLSFLWLTFFFYYTSWSSSAISCVQKTQFSSMTLFIYFFFSKRIHAQIVRGAILTYL